MHQNPKYVSLYRCQLSDAFVLVFLFRHQCAAPFCLCPEGKYINLRIDIRQEAEQNILRIENIVKSYLRVSREYSWAGKGCPLPWSFRRRFHHMKRASSPTFNKIQKIENVDSLHLRQSKYRVKLDWWLGTSQSFKSRKGQITLIFICCQGKNSPREKRLGNTWSEY